NTMAQVDTGKSRSSQTKVYVRNGCRDFGNVRFLIEIRASWLRSPLSTQRIMDDLMNDRICVTDAYKSFTKTVKPIFEQ
ncbi:hypothetical protein PFISCL1PPCAC_3195, partial [Pristionchus fissidentatus]